MQSGDRTAAEAEGEEKYIVKAIFIYIYIYIPFRRVNQLEKPIRKLKQNFRGLTL